VEGVTVDAGAGDDKVLVGKNSTHTKVRDGLSNTVMIGE
jgi:hypothetical protein